MNESMTAAWIVSRRARQYRDFLAERIASNRKGMRRWDWALWDVLEHANRADFREWKRHPERLHRLVEAAEDVRLQEQRARTAAKTA